MISLYTATVPSFVQMVEATAGVIAKGEAFAAERGIAPETLIGGRLAPDMLDFAYQVKSVAVHSLGAIDGVRRGVFTPDFTPPPTDFVGLHDRIADTAAALRAVDPGEIDGLLGRDMTFAIGERRMEFTAEDFLLSFSLPNLYFHATTAYAILRAAGVPLGKRDYLGRPRLKS